LLNHWRERRSFGCIFGILKSFGICVYSRKTAFPRLKISGAGGGTRTPTGIRPTDFKSGMSTIPSRPQTD
jgi:hypothetical protein